MPALVVGSVPRGEDYFGQEGLIDNIRAKLKTDNILLTAPRRFGKTAAMYKLCDDPWPPFLPVYTNVEHIMSAADFMVELIATLYQEHQFKRVINKLWVEAKDFGRFLGNLPEDIDIGGLKIKIRESTDVPVNWHAYGEQVMALLAEEEPRLLLILDEFAVMIDHIARKNREEAEQLLRWFRAARIARGTRTRFVIGGSIHLIPTLDAMGLVDTVNDLYIQKLKPFTPETVRHYIKAIFSPHNIKLTPEVRDTILKLTGAPIPYLLAVLLTAVFDQQRATKSEITPEMVKEVFYEDLLGGATSATFHHYRSRIDRYYPGWEGQTAKAVLGSLSRAEKGMEKQTLYQVFLTNSNMQHLPQAEDSFMQLMNKLDNDFYISFDDGRYEFFSRVLKLWWKTHYGFQGE